MRKKRFLSILLTLVMLVSFLPTMAWATETHNHSVEGIESWTAWGDEAEEKTSLPTGAGSYYLTEDVTLSTTWNVPAGDDAEHAKITNLCLNGHVIKFTGESGSVINVPQYATLNLYDCGSNTHKFGDTDGLWTWNDDLTDDNIKHTVTGGVITGGNTSDGGGVTVAAGGTFNMYGGNITGNTADNGGGVRNLDTFTMTGGTISGNTAKKGGGIYTASIISLQGEKSETVNILTGGSITGNTATEEDGGGMYYQGEECFAAGTLITMADGSRKPIETLKIGDVVRVFDHDTGTISTAKLFDLWKYPEKHSGAVTLHFSHGIDLTVVYGHSFFDKTANKYVAVTRDNVDFYVGHEFYNVDDGRWETLIGYDFLDGEVDTYVITSEAHLNCVANGMLSNEDGFYTTLTNIFEYGDGLKIDAEKKADDLERYGLFGYEELPYASRETYNVLNLQYLNVAFGKGMVTKDALLSLGAYWAEVDPELLCGTAVQQGVDDAGEAYFLATAKSVQNGNGPLPGVYLGGAIKIIDNFKCTGGSKTTNNLYLTDSKAITLGTSTDGTDGNAVLKPADGMKVGVTMQNGTGVFSGENGADYSARFTPDAGSDYKVISLANNYKLKLVTKYAVNVADGIQNGTVTTNVTEAFEGDAVTVTVTPNSGYRLKADSLTVTQTGGAEAVEIFENTFIMPAYAVTVSAEFKKIPASSGGGTSSYSVEPSSAASAKNGTFSMDKKNAAAGSTVTVTVAPDKGFTLETLTVLDKNGKEIEVKSLGNNKYSFKMPASKVTVEATFMEDNTMLNFCVDVKASDYYYDAVLWAYENGVCTGTDAVHFSPDVPTTRAQVVTFLWRAAGCPVVNYWMRMDDVKSGEYYTEAVRWALSEGITKGTTDTAFEPETVCTRGQIATFLARFAGVKDADTQSDFTDVPADEFFAAAVKWAKDNGVTDGTTATTFEPYANCTRAEVVTFLYRWMVK